MFFGETRLKFYQAQRDAAREPWQRHRRKTQPFKSSKPDKSARS
jgi:hypothetical protein